MADKPLLGNHLGKKLPSYHVPGVLTQSRPAQSAVAFWSSLVPRPEPQEAVPFSQRISQLAKATEESLEGPLLRYSKRLELLKLGQRLGIDRFQSALVIAQVQYRQASPDQRRDTAEDHAGTLPGRRSIAFLKVSAMFLVAGLIDLIVLRAIFH